MEWPVSERWILCKITVLAKEVQMEGPCTLHKKEDKNTAER